ncbi:hypothetical protein [Candidatus Kuenenia sp.]
MTNKFQMPNRDFGHWNFTAVHCSIIRINPWIQVANLNPPGVV